MCSQYLDFEVHSRLSLLLVFVQFHHRLHQEHIQAIEFHYQYFGIRLLLMMRAIFAPINVTPTLPPVIISSAIHGVYFSIASAVIFIGFSDNVLQDELRLSFTLSTIALFY